MNLFSSVNFFDSSRIYKNAGKVVSYTNYGSRAILNFFIKNFKCIIFRRYGDKTPKSVAARLFAVGWIMIGVTICSILTATLSSALTSVTVESVGVIAGIKVHI